MATVTELGRLTVRATATNPLPLVLTAAGAAAHNSIIIMVTLYQGGVGTSTFAVNDGTANSYATDRTLGCTGSLLNQVAVLSAHDVAAVAQSATINITISGGTVTAGQYWDAIAYAIDWGSGQHGVLDLTVGNSVFDGGNYLLPAVPAPYTVGPTASVAGGNEVLMSANYLYMTTPSTMAITGTGTWTSGTLADLGSGYTIGLQPAWQILSSASGTYSVTQQITEGSDNTAEDYGGIIAVYKLVSSAASGAGAFAPGTFTMAAAARSFAATATLAPGAFTLSASERSFAATAPLHPAAFVLAATAGTIVMGGQPSVVREILLDAQCGYDPNGGPGWGSHKTALVRLSDGTILALSLSDGTYESAISTLTAKQWRLYSIPPSMTTNVSTPLTPIATGNAGRERPHILRRSDDSYVVISWHPDWSNTTQVAVEQNPWLWDSRTGTESQLPGGWSHVYWDARWPYSGACIDASDNIWLLQNNNNLSPSYQPYHPAYNTVGYYNNAAATWTVQQYTYNDMRHAYAFLFPRLDLGAGGVEWVGSKDGDWDQDWVPLYAFVRPVGANDDFIFNGLGFLKVPTLTSSAITFVRGPYSQQGTPPDRPYYQIADAFLSADQKIHVFIDGHGVIFGGTGQGNYGGHHLIVNRDTGVVESTTDNPMLFQNQSRLWRGTDGRYWILALSSAYPINGGDPMQFRWIAATDADSNGTLWQTPYTTIPLQTTSAIGGGSDRFFIANQRNGSVADPANHVHMVVSTPPKTIFVEVVLPTGPVGGGGGGGGGGTSGQAWVNAATSPSAGVVFDASGVRVPAGETFSFAADLLAPDLAASNRLWFEAQVIAPYASTSVPAGEYGIFFNWQKSGDWTTYIQMGFDPGAKQFYFGRFVGGSGLLAYAPLLAFGAGDTIHITGWCDNTTVYCAVNGGTVASNPNTAAPASVLDTQFFIGSTQGGNNTSQWHVRWFEVGSASFSASAVLQGATAPWLDATPRLYPDAAKPQVRWDGNSSTTYQRAAPFNLTATSGALVPAAFVMAAVAQSWTSAAALHPGAFTLTAATGFGVVASLRPAAFIMAAAGTAGGAAPVSVAAALHPAAFTLAGSQTRPVAAPFTASLAIQAAGGGSITVTAPAASSTVVLVAAGGGAISVGAQYGTGISVTPASGGSITVEG